MSYETRYTEVRELTDEPHATTARIDGGGWDWHKVAVRKREIAEATFTDEVIYVVGHRVDAH